MNKKAAQKRAILQLLITDYITAVITWFIFWNYRHNILKDVLGEWYQQLSFFNLRDILITFLLLPASWLGLYYLSGTYFDPYRKSRVIEINRTLVSCFIGVLIIGFIIFANDTDSFSYFFEITTWYFIAQVLLTLMGRMFVLKRVKNNIVKHDLGYKTIIVGGNGKADAVYRLLESKKNYVYNKIIGFVLVNNVAPNASHKSIPILGHVEELKQLVNKFKIEEVIIAIESSEHKIIESILLELSYSNVIIKVIPDYYDIIAGSVKTNNVFDTFFLNIYPELLPDWQQVCKRVIDILLSGIAILLLSPLYFLAAIKVRLSSKGPILYRQKRIGLLGKKFNIYKFRSMFIDAEVNGPALSSDEDKRITKWGKVMRKWRIDELPQFFNILKGDMSLVGPRPERQYFIDKILKSHPHYKFLHKVKPGLTSWGMVQYGYAENVEQMIERMRYDLLYIKNCSLALDVKIMLHTIKVILQGRGK